MNFEKLAPNIFYANIADSLKLFVDCLGFTIGPNLKEITLRPWGAKEFALMDKQLGVIIQQW